MKEKKDIKSFLLFFLIILAVVGFSYGTTQLQKIGSQTPDSHAPYKKKNAGYLISRPSQGSLIQTENITLKYLPNDQASALLPNEYLNKVNIHQDVILYDENNIVMPLGGKIKSIAPHEGQLEIIISLPKATKTQYLSRNADIITLEARASLRFPLSALQQDKNGNYYVWSAEKTQKEGEFQAKKTWLKKPLLGNNNFVAGAPVGLKTFVLLEPNKKMKHKKVYKMKRVRYKTSRHTPIKQAYYDYQAQQRKRKRDEEQKKLADCQNKANAAENNTSPGAISEACRGESINSESDPMDIFNSILLREPEETSSGSCSSCSL